MSNVSEKYRRLIVFVLFILGLKIPLVSLLGLILMWKWTKIRRWIKILITVPFLFAFISTLFVIMYLFFLRPVQIVGQAMYPNYVNGQYYMTVHTGDVTRGEVVVLEAPDNPRKDYIKRVIGLPGDTVLLQNGFVYLNGQVLDESKYLLGDTKTYGGTFLQEGQTVTVSQEAYFVMGDNRTSSTDSREWGFVLRKDIVSKVTFCYWKCNK